MWRCRCQTVGARSSPRRRMRCVGLNARTFLVIRLSGAPRKKKKKKIPARPPVTPSRATSFPRRPPSHAAHPARSARSGAAAAHGGPGPGAAAALAYQPTPSASNGHSADAQDRPGEQQRYENPAL